MNKKRKLFAAFLMAFMLAIMGCAAFQDSICPVYIPPDCIVFADADVPVILPYTTLSDAKYVDKKMDYVHSIGQLEYTFLKENLGDHIANAEQFKSATFDPSGPLGLLLPSLTCFGLGSMLISKPEDRKKIVELEKKLNGGA